MQKTWINCIFSGLKAYLIDEILFEILAIFHRCFDQI
jgi:hypothetical protein